MRKTVDILGVNVDYITMKDAVERVISFLGEDMVHAIYTPNAEIMMAAQRDLKLRQVLNKADMLVADGAGVVLASNLLGLNLPEKVSGIDLTRNTFKAAASRTIKFYFFGGQTGVAEEAARKITSGYPGVEVVGCRNGFFEAKDVDGIINDINSSGAEILLVALGAPKQENWIHGNKDKLKVKVCVGVGGSLDVFAGKAKLAPDFFRRNGLEWLYRLYKNPSRFKRMLDLPRFMALVFAKKLRLR